MPTISFISPKGGVGKTTAATILAVELASKAKVIVIDADPNRPIETWAKLGNMPANIEIVADANQENILDKIEEAARRAPFVVVDCEGTASLTVAYAIGASDLVIVPSQGSQLDAKQAAKALSLIKNTEKQSRRSIAHAVLLTRTNPAVKPRTLVNIQEQLRKHGVAMFNTQMHEREAYRAMFSFGGTVQTLDPKQVTNLDKAAANARAFANEVVAMLKASQANAVSEVA
jgi:chromosome partitioning protein